MARRLNPYRRSDVPLLQVGSSSFGSVNAGYIERSFMATGRQLRSRLLDLVDGVSAGAIDQQAFTAGASLAVRSAYSAAYSLGAISVFPFYTLTDRDIQILNQELFEERTFLRRFGKELERGLLTLDPYARARLYVLALRGIFERGRLEAMPSVPIQWILGETEHCDDCISAAARGPYRKPGSTDGDSNLPELPGTPSDGSICLGFTRCGCRLSPVDVPAPNEGLAETLREVLLEIVNEPYVAA